MVSRRRFVSDGMGDFVQGSLDQPPIVLRSRRARAVWLIIGSAGFVTMGLFSLESTGPSLASLLSIGFFGLCGLVGAGLLIAPPRLEVSPSGLTQMVMWRTTKYAWTDIYNFRPAGLGWANKTVGFDYLTERPKGTGLKRLNTALAGRQGYLQPGWEIAPQDLANLLNDARERWLEATAGAAQPSVYATPSQPVLMAALTGARIDRKGYWLAAFVVFAGVVSVSFVLGIHDGLAPLTTLLFIRIYASRLHDFGRSGWWQLLLYGIQIPAIVLVGTAAGLPPAASVGAGFLTQLIFTAVVGAIPGNPGANRFGPPPNQRSAIAIAETFR